MHKHRKLSDEQIAFVFRELCESINYIHSFGILHRDIKLENLLFDANYHMKLADFGFACMVTSPEKRTTVCGTREYFAPEIYTSKKQNLKLDIWCLGIILYELCHNRTPFNLAQKDFKEANRELKSLRYRCNLNINPLFRDAIDKCLQYDQKVRVDIRELLQHRMFKICEGLSSNVMRMKTTSKSQPRKSLPVYRKIRKRPLNKIVRPPNQVILNPYVSAFSKPLGNRYFPNKNGIYFAQKGKFQFKNSRYFKWNQ